MILVLAALLALAAPPEPASPPSGQAPPVTVTAPNPEDAAVEAAKVADQVHEIYQVSCAGREYGTYDDLCNVLDQQLKEAQRDAAHKAKLAAQARAAERKAPR